MIDLMKSRNTVLGQTAFQRHGKNSSIYKHWRNKFQREIKLAKSHYYKHKVAELGQTNPPEMVETNKKSYGTLNKTLNRSGIINFLVTMGMLRYSQIESVTSS